VKNSPPEKSAPLLVSVCIVTYKRDDTLVDSLRRLLASTCLPSEIFVVDNARSTALPERLREFAVPVELIYPVGNVGCAGLNLAFAKATGKYIFCFDDDSFPAPDCIEKAVRAFESDPTLGMIGFKMHDPGTRLPWHDPWWNPDCAVARPTVFCPGCGLAFRNDSRLPAELCVPDIVSQAHELSMAAEILRLGYRIEFRPDCVAFHPDTTKGYSGEKARNGNRNQLRFLIRYADGGHLAVLLFSQFLLFAARRPNEMRFAFDYFFSARRRALPRRIARQFREIFSWHAHPKLGRLL
jgi:GT2 family glycosyltransferase